MSRISWGGFEFDSKYLVQTKKCTACRDSYPEDQVNVNGLCERCQDIESKLLERLAGTWASKVLDDDEKQLKKQIGWW